MIESPSRTTLKLRNPPQRMLDGVGQLLLVARDTVDVDERSGQEGDVLAEVQVGAGGGLGSHDAQSSSRSCARLSIDWGHD